MRITSIGGGTGGPDGQMYNGLSVLLRSPAGRCFRGFGGIGKANLSISQSSGLGKICQAVIDHKPLPVGLLITLERIGKMPMDTWDRKLTKGLPPRKGRTR